MKNYILPLLILFSFNSYSQLLGIEQKPSQTEENISVDSWIIHLESDVSFAQSTLMSFMKGTFDIKTERRNKNLLVVPKVTLREISNLRVDMRASFSVESSGCSVSFMFSPGYDIHFGNVLYKEEFSRAENFVKNYLRFHYREFYKKRIEDVGDKMKDIQKDIAVNEKKIDRNKGYIKDNDEKIIGGDAAAAKYKDRNTKLGKENENLLNEIAKWREEYKKMEDEIIKINGSIKTVEEYK